MGIFSSPFDSPMSTKKLIGIVVYLFLSIVSIWATSKSISLTYELPKSFSIFIGIAIILVMASGISIIASAIQNRRIGMLFMGLVVFLISWLISLTTNTHSFYLADTLKKIQEKEIKDVYSEINNLDVSSQSILNTIISHCRSTISSKIRAYESEVADLYNPGDGKIAHGKKLDVESSLPGHTFPDAYCNNCNQSQWIKVARQAGQLMTQALENVLQSIEATFDPVKCKNESQLAQFEDDLKDCYNAFESQDPKVIRRTISLAYNYYGQQISCINSLFSTNLDCYSGEKLPVYKLELIPGSIQLESISNTYKHVIANKESTFTNFLFALLLALGIDLGAFAIFYFIILKEEEEYN